MPIKLATDRGSFRRGVTVGLACLGVPRVVLHDLDVVDEGDPVNLLLVFGPLVAWVACAVLADVSPLRALLWVGLCYGVLLAGAHQLLWNEAFADDPPHLGGNLEGKLSPGIEEVVLRCFSVASSLVTGVAVGAACGLVARVVVRLARPS